jgi:hypothetical protein
MTNLSDLFLNGIDRNTFSYPEYMQLMERLVLEKRTTGPKQSEDLAHYTKMNLQRMQRLNKTVVLNEDLVSLITKVHEPQTWYILTEAWCGDAAQLLPVFAAMARINPLINIQLLLRDENPDFMDIYLTNAARSIPKLVALDSEFNELFQWGPRPAGAQQLLYDYKANPEKTYKVFSEEIQRWYIADKTQSVQAEMLSLLQGVLPGQ